MRVWWSMGVLELLRQQRLPSWQPLPDPRSSTVCLFVLAVLFIPLGALFTIANQTAFDLEVRYDHISRCTYAHNHGVTEYRGDNGEHLRAGCLTKVQFELDAPLKAPVYLYYGLSQFYQNHRRFSNSKSDAQLRGSPVTAGSLGNCAPLASPSQLRPSLRKRAVKLTDERGSTRVVPYADFSYAPAGLIPWSLFNDTFRLLYEADGSLVCDGAAFSRVTNEPVPTTEPNHCHKKGIAWAVDTQGGRYKPLSFSYDAVDGFDDSGTVEWSAPRSLYYGGDRSLLNSNDTFFNNGWYADELGHNIPVTTDEDLMVWARASSLPRFRKLYRVIDVDLKPGIYSMEIREFFDATSYGGEKIFALSRPSWLGGQNYSLSNIFLLTGVLSLAGLLLFSRLQPLYVSNSLKAIGELAE